MVYWCETYLGGGGISEVIVYSAVYLSHKKCPRLFVVAL